MFVGISVHSGRDIVLKADKSDRRTQRAVILRANAILRETDLRRRNSAW